MIHNGDLYRIISPNTNPYRASWMFVSQDKKEAILTYIASANHPNNFLYLKLAGLDERKFYYCKETNKTYYGKQLLECGISLNIDTVYAGGSRFYHFIAQN